MMLCQKFSGWVVYLSVHFWFNRWVSIAIIIYKSTIRNSSTIWFNLSKIYYPFDRLHWVFLFIQKFPWEIYRELNFEILILEFVLEKNISFVKNYLVHHANSRSSPTRYWTRWVSVLPKYMKHFQMYLCQTRSKDLDWPIPYETNRSNFCIVP